MAEQEKLGEPINDLLDIVRDIGLGSCRGKGEHVEKWCAMYEDCGSCHAALADALLEEITAAMSSRITNAIGRTVEGERAMVTFNPLDIDGNPIAEGDEVDVRGHDGKWELGHTVVAICEDGCYVNGPAGAYHVWRTDIRHHKEPTLQEVLHELVMRCVTIADVKECDGGYVPVLGCNDDALEEWLCENEGVLRLGDAV